MRKKAKQNRSTKKVLSVAMAATLLLVPLSPVGQLFPAGTTEAASCLPMPETPGCRLLNKVTAGSESLYRQSYSLGEEMANTGASGGAWMASRYGEINMDGATVFGKRLSWSLTFEKQDFQGNLPDETMFRMGGAVSNYKGSSIRMGDGISFGESCSEDGLTKDYATEWLPFSDMKAVVRGSGEASVTYLWYVLADITSPGEKGWEMDVVTQAGEDTPVLWLSCTETLRPANAEITPELLTNMKLRLGLVPRKNPGETPVYVTAEAVQLSSDNRGIGFRVKDSDWEGLSGKEYQIVSIQNASAGQNYKLTEYSGSGGASVTVRTVRLPVTDIAGNPVQFPETALNVKAQGLILDVQPPTVETVKLTGTAVDASAQASAEGWPEDIERSRLFSSVGDEVQLRLQLSEAIVHPSEKEMKNIVLTWNLNRNGVPVTSRLIGIEEGYSNGVNGGIVSTLVFEKITITRNMAPQGERIQAVSLTGGEFLRDYSKNPVAQDGQPLDVSGVSPDCWNCLDTEGPTAEINQAVLIDKTDQEAYYTIALSIQDGGSGAEAAGVAGQTGQISLTSYANAPQMTYEYEISRSANRLDTLTKKGTIGGKGNEVWSSFPTTGDGVYYLHLKLTDLEGKELDDIQGLTLKLQLTDILSNTAETSLSLTDLGLDQVAPRLSLTQKGISISSGAAGSSTFAEEDDNSVSDGNAGGSEFSQAAGNSVSSGNAVSSVFAGAAGDNTAVFVAEAEASDTNGIARMEYQWADTGNSAAENGWTVVSWDGTVSQRQEFTDSVSGQQSISRTLYVRAYDKYGNYTEKSLTMGADLSKAVGQFQVTGDPETPSADTDVMIAKPAATGAGSSVDSASTRAMVEVDGKTYVRIFTGDTPRSLLDHEASDWYLVEAENGSYSSVAQQAPDWSFYGTVTITLAHSLEDLTPVSGSEVNPAADTTLVQDDPMTIQYAPVQPDVHSVVFTGAENSAGEQINATTASGYTYYKAGRSMAGIRFLFTLNNTKIPEWNQEDVDFDASYAVLIKADAQGNPQDTAEVTERAPLGGGESQSFSVPSSDQDGNAFASGAYVLKVFVRQKAGGEQTFYSNVPILLDASGIPGRFGVLSYTRTTRAAYTNNSDRGEGLSQTYQAAEGDVLHTINVGVAKPDGFNPGTDSSTGMPLETPGTVMEVGGQKAYLTSTQNALDGSRFGYQDSKLTLQLTAQWNETERPGEYLGVQMGRVQGIKYWNGASSGNPAELEYREAVFSGESLSEDAAGMVELSAYIKWYDETCESAVVTREELAQKSVGDFALALGGNTVCYQLRMENGLESPVYQFDLNLCDQAPTLELEYSFGPSVFQKDVINDDGSTTAAVTKYAEYIDVSVKDAFSAYGGLTVYHARYDETGKKWVYDELEQDGRIRLTRAGNGYAGFLGTRTDITVGQIAKNYNIREFICAVDAAGNAVSAFPILADAAAGDAEDLYYYGIKEDCTFFTVEAPVEMENVLPAEYEISFDTGQGTSLTKVVDYYTVQIDDREPVKVDTEWSSWYFQDISNHAGITRLKDKGFCFVLPYDPSAGEGVQVSHTVKVTACGYRETSASLPAMETAEFTVTGVNRKPAVEVDKENMDNVSVGYVPIVKTAVVQDTGAGIYYWNNMNMNVYSNGTYVLNLRDKYGEEYTQELSLDCLPDDPKITVSTMKPTAGPVVVTAVSDKYLLTSSVPDGAGGTQQQPVSTGENTKKLQITVPENCFFSLYWNEEGQEDFGQQSAQMFINNIDATAIEPEVQWQYDENAVEDGNIYRGEATAILVDKNGKCLTDPLTGSRPSYVFVPGGDTQYTFSGYVDESGKTGPDITAKLPVTLLPYESQIEDRYAPDLAITGYVIRRGISSEVQAAYMLTHDRPEESRIGLPDYGNENKYGAENIFTDMQDMVDKMFWADSYLLRIETADESAVRLFVRRGLSDGVPDYETGRSDAIDGVSLTGRTLQISKNAEFVLYAVDEKGNHSVVPIRVTALGGLPEPEYFQVLTKNRDEVRVYLLPPPLEGVSNLRITNDDDNDGNSDALTEEDSGSAFFGKQYLSVRENETILLYYSYGYFDTECSGSLKIPVSGIDKDPAVAVETKWSANYDPAGGKFTNQEISVQIRFDKPLGAVTLTDADGTDLGINPGAATAAWLENRVTVVYGENAPEYRLKVQPLANARETEIKLPEIKTIDKESPQVTADISYAENHRSAVITITSNEEGCLVRTGSKGTTFRQTVRENGTYTCSVADMAGNQGQATVLVDGLVTEELVLLLSTGGTDESVIDPETYKAEVGEQLYAKTNRPADLFINGSGSGRMNAGVWTSFEIREDSEGLYPSVRAVDDYGNAALVQMLRIPMGDRTAPVLLLNKKQLSASSQKSDEELRTMLLSNAVYSDDTTGQDRLKMEISFDRNGGGDRVPVTYTVTDEAGNQTEAVCWLRLYDGSEPQVTVNGNPVEWGETMAVQSGTQTLHILSNGEPYKVYQKTGIKTEAQMKTGAVSLSGYTAEKEQELAVEITEQGYYTFCITTQGRGTCRFVLYVEE